MRLLLADDHTLFRDALVQYIHRTDPDVEMSLAKDFYEAFDAVKSNENFDLILLDLRMPGMVGLGGLQKMREHYPNIPVGIMSGIAEPQDVREAMSLGAAGYFPKTLSGKALMRAIQLVLAGERFLPIDQDTNGLMPSYKMDKDEEAEQKPPSNFNFYGDQQDPANDGDQRDYKKLTPREHDVLVYLSQGMSNKEIARELDLQVVTVKLHVRGICKKLHAQNRTQAALKARDIGIV